MSEAANIGILQDMTFIAVMAVALGLLGYRVMRRLRPEVTWNHEGLVVSRPYADIDLVVMTAGLAMLLQGIMQPVTEAAKKTDLLPDVSMIVLSMVMQLMIAALLLIYLSQLRGLNPAELFGFNLIRWRMVLRTIVLWTVPMLLVVGGAAYLANHWLQGVAPGGEEQELVKMFQTSDDLGLRATIIMAAVVGAPIAEEIMFRGFIYGVLKRYTDGPFAAIISGLFFAIMHSHVGSLVPLWVLAVILCAAYEITGCLLVPMLLHALFNSTSISVMLFGN